MRREIGSAPWYFDGRRWYVKDRQGGKFYWYRVVMWDATGRELLAGEQVHHLNGDPTDDRVENLAIVSAEDHNRLHLADKIHSPAARKRAGKSKRRRVSIPCGNCGTLIERRPSDLGTKGRAFCNKGCLYAAIRSGVVSTHPRPEPAV